MPVELVYRAIYNYALKALHLICHVQLKAANLLRIPDPHWNEVPVLMRQADVKL